MLSRPRSPVPNDSTGPAKSRPLVVRAIGGHLLAVFIAATLLWSLIVAWAGAVTLVFGSVRLSSRTPARPMTLAVVAVLLHALLLPGGFIRRGLERLSRVEPVLVRWAPALLVVFTLWLGIHWGTWVAGGSDAYGYVSQADLWAKGGVRIDQPWTAPFDWPMAASSFAPLGYRPGPVPLSIVPTYSAGVPMIMAAAKLLVGPDGPFLVVPILGALAVYLTYRLGRKIAGGLAGVLAACLLATSPAFLYNLMVPVSDVSAAALWTLAAALALGNRRAAPWLAGLAASAAILVRPNIAPLLAVPAIALLAKSRPKDDRRESRRVDLVKLTAAALPGIAAVALINVRLYGGVLQSGYGKLLDQFDLSRGIANLGRYAWWFWDTQPVVALLVLVGLAASRAIGWTEATPASAPVGPRSLLVAMIAAPLACYLLYLTFDEWTYLRFLLPAYPALMILGAVGLAQVSAAFSREWRFGAIAVVMAGVVTAQCSFAVERGAFDLRRSEHRYLSVAQEIERRIPANAMVICVQHSGSLRYYGHRLTLRWDWLPPEWLDRALLELQQQGYQAYVLLEDEEFARFLERFAASPAGQLRGAPVARIPPSCTLIGPLLPEP